MAQCRLDRGVVVTLDEADARPVVLKALKGRFPRPRDVERSSQKQVPT